MRQWKAAESNTFHPQINMISNLIVQNRSRDSTAALPKHEQLFMMSKEKREGDSEEGLGTQAPFCTFAPEINPKTQEILAHSALPSDFLKRQRVASAMSQKKMRALQERNDVPFCPTLVAKYPMKLEVA